MVRNEAAEKDVEGEQKGEVETRPTMRALGRSASSKIKMGLGPPTPQPGPGPASPRAPTGARHHFVCVCMIGSPAQGDLSKMDKIGRVGLLYLIPFIFCLCMYQYGINMYLALNARI